VKHCYLEEEVISLEGCGDLVGSQLLHEKDLLHHPFYLQTQGKGKGESEDKQQLVQSTGM